NFGTNPALAITSNWLIKNTGCLPLNITGTAVNTSSATGEFLPGFAPKPIDVSNNLLTTSSSIADKLTSGKWDMMIRGNGATEEVVSSREVVNSAALAAPPVWWVSLDDPNAGDVIMPGDSMQLKFTINQPLLSRGPNYAWITLESDDPDFFLNDAAKDPECRLRLIGGCLADTSLLTFGMGSANYRMVWNTGRIGDGDEEPSHGFHIDNVASEHQYFQGSYIYAITLRRAAWNSKEWSGSTIDEWWSLQGDYNWCDNTCKPAIVSPYAVPAISTDGITYNTITANMVCRSYIDSVQNFWTGSAWNLRLYSSAPFDNDSTIGLLVKSRVIGAVDVPELANVTVDIMEVSERNGNKVPNWYMGSFHDYDIGTGDTSGLDRSVSVAYAWAKGQTNGIWGEIKLPFGCGQEPIRNTKGMVGTSGLYPNNQPYFDSLYKYLSAAPGTHASQVTTGGDFEQANSFIKKDTIFPNEKFTYGVASFGFPANPHGGSGAVAPAIVKDLARLVNKWTGWGRGDVNNDNAINLADVVYLAATVNFGGPGAIPFEHLGDVNASGGAPDQADVDFLINFYFGCGPCPAGAWTM
ncbi:MAG: hypothetical protein HY851_07180, partial [candidate division Zixibacteria bacterium]|nr:hypothetical protein [candidate division Zixibacteria bacterium]